MKENKTKIKLASGTIVNMDTYKGSEGEIACDIETKQFYRWQDGWIPVNLPKEVDMNLNLYDLNVQLVEQFKDITDKETLKFKAEQITEFMHEYQNNYYLLYGKEISYFTLFKKVAHTENAGDVVIECLENIGPIKCIDLTENKDAIEAWVNTPEGKVTCLYLFPYDGGLVEVDF